MNRNSEAKKQEHYIQNLGRTRAMLRAHVQNNEALLEEARENGLPESRLHHICRRDAQRAREVLAA